MDKRQEIADLYLDFLRSEKRWYLNEPLLFLIKECAMIESDLTEIRLGHRPSMEHSRFQKAWFDVQFEGIGFREDKFERVYIFLLINFRGLDIKNEFEKFGNYLKNM